MNTRCVNLFVALASGCLISVGSFASEPQVEVFEVRGVEVIEHRDSCTVYALEVLDQEGGVQEKRMCLRNGTGHNGPSIWVIEGDRVIGAFRVYLYSNGGEVTKVVELRTNEYFFEPEHYLALKVPRYVENFGKDRCVTNAQGVLPVKTFVQYWKSDREASRQKRSRRIEDVIRQSQPWCDSEAK